MLILSVAALAVVASGPPVVVDARLGPAYLTRSHSHAVGHLLRPAARVGARALVGQRLELGGSAVGLLLASEHYRVLGALAHARYAVWTTPRFSLGTGAGLGLGYDADILHRDLHAQGGVAPYGLVAVDGRWTLTGRWLIGVEAAWENLASINLGLLVGWGGR